MGGAADVLAQDVDDKLRQDTSVSQDFTKKRLELEKIKVDHVEIIVNGNKLQPSLSSRLTRGIKFESAGDAFDLNNKLQEALSSDKKSLLKRILYRQGIQDTSTASVSVKAYSGNEVVKVFSADDAQKLNRSNVPNATDAKTYRQRGKERTRNNLRNLRGRGTHQSLDID